MSGLGVLRPEADGSDATEVTIERLRERIAELEARATPAMDLERAREIVGAMTMHVSHAFGITADAPPSLREYSLQEMVTANRLVREDPGELNPKTGAWSFQMHCDDRLTAALYVLYHFPPQDIEDDVQPVAQIGRTGLFVLRVPEEGGEHG